MQYHNAPFNFDPVALKLSKLVFRIHPIMTGDNEVLCRITLQFTRFPVLLGLQATHAYVTCHYWNCSTAQACHRTTVAAHMSSVKENKSSEVLNIEQ